MAVSTFSLTARWKCRARSYPNLRRTFFANKLKTAQQITG